MCDSRESLNYQVYVLRIWQEQQASSGQPDVWRFSLEDPRTQNRRGFDDLEMLMAFLEGESVKNQLQCRKISEKEDVR